MEVSLIYIIYQMTISRDFFYVIKNAMSQTIKPQIIICEQNSTTTEWLRELCLELDITYIFFPEPSDYALKGNMGLLKNLCLKRATSDYIYFSDTDIVFLKKNYLESLLCYMKASSQPILVRPPMLRLFSGKEELLKRFEKQNYSNIQIHNPECHCGVRFIGEQIIAHGKEQYKFFNNLPHFSMMFQPDKWQLTYHSGGIFVKKSTLLDVGGYGMDYFYWGMDDIDLQWKLNESFGARAISECVPGMSVLHFEHPSRCDEIIYQKNRSVFENRRSDGLNAVIEKDVIAYEKLSGILLY